MFKPVKAKKKIYIFKWNFWAKNALKVVFQCFDSHVMYGNWMIKVQYLLTISKYIHREMMKETSRDYLSKEYQAKFFSFHVEERMWTKGDLLPYMFISNVYDFHYILRKSHPLQTYPCLEREWIILKRI